MQKGLMIIMAFLFAFFIASQSSHAMLWDNAGGVIYDDDCNITRLHTAPHEMTAGHDADNLTYSWQARSWENGLNYYDSAAVGPFDGGWTDPKEHINENFAWSHYFKHRDHFIHSHDDDNNVVTVHDRHHDNPTTVPEPSTLLLLAAGLAGLAVGKKRYSR